MESLDRLDRRILFELDRDSRQSYSALARKTRQGRDKIAYRVERLIEQKIIKTFVTSVNVYKLGLTIYKVYLRVENDRKKIPELIHYLRSHPRTYWICMSDGSWDVMLAFLARSPQEFYQIQQDMLVRFNESILDFRVFTLIDVRMYRKNYFIGKGSEYFSVGGEPGTYRLDPIDYELLKILSEDARCRISELAYQTNTTPSIVQYRIEKLEALEIIIGYRIDIDLSKLNMLAFKTLLFLNNYSEELLNEFQDYCDNTPHIAYVVRQIGETSIELELAVNSYEQYYQSIENLRARFSNLIRNFQTILMRRQDYHWVPRDLAVD